MNKIDEWTKLDKLDKIGLIGQNWTKMIIVLNITDKVEDSDKMDKIGKIGQYGQNWSKLPNWTIRTKYAKIHKIGQKGQNWTKRTKLDNIRELDSMMNKLKKNMNCVIQI